jgi:hypothetical protein
VLRVALVALTGFCAVALAGSPALAADTEATGSEADRAQAQALFDEAARLTEEGKFEAACGKLEQSYAAHAGVGTAYNLARCWQKIGRTASAYRLFETVVKKTAELGQTEREQAARQRLDALLPKLSRLRIDLTARTPRTEVRRNGELVPQGDWEKPIPLDPGQHEVSVSESGKETWSLKVDLKEPGTIAVLVPELRDAKPPEPPKPAPLAAKAAVAKPAPPPEPPPSNALRNVGLALGGVGIASAAAAVFFGVQYDRKNDEAKAICPASTNCTAQEIEQHAALVDDARTARTLMYVGAGVAGASFVAASYLIFIVPSGGDGKTGRIGVAPRLDARSGWGANLVGSF